MALQVWLPLNRDLRQQGLATEYPVNTNTATIDSAGKLGQCYKFSATTGKGMLLGGDCATFMNTYINNHSWSMGAWVKNSVSEDTAIISLSYGLRLFAGGSTYVSLYNSSRVVSCTSSVGTGDGKWHHIMATYDVNTNAIKIYVDGVNTGSATYTSGYKYASSWTNGLFIGRDPNNSTANAHYFYQGSLNDVRIYDHCLSPMEVKQLSQGLVLHYPLSDAFNDEKENLMPANYWSGTKTVSLAANTTNYGIINYPAISVKTDTTYFWTVRFRITSGGSNLTSIGVDTNCSGGSYSGNDSAHTVITISNPNLTKIKEGKWQTAYCITKVKSDATNPTIFHTIYGNSSTATTLTVEWYSLMLVESAEVVPFRGQHNNIIYDCSGFCNNGTISGNLTISNDTPKYQASTKFSDGSYIKYKGPESMYQATYAFWVKSDSYTAYNMIHGPLNSPVGGTSPWLSVNTESSGAWAYFGGNEPHYTKTTGGNLSVNAWHHLVYVWDNGVAQWYIDGIVAGNPVTYTTRTFIPNTTESSIGDSYTGTSWGGTPFTGQLSDFRIYTTALSANDVKSLYQNSAYIDSSGNVYGQIRS